MHGLSYFLGVNDQEPTQRYKAKPSDRRALSPDDITELLDTEPDGPSEYDPLFWDEWNFVLKTAGRVCRDRIAAWRIRKDFEYLRKQGWYPNGEGYIWDQIAQDMNDGLMPWATLAWRKRIRQSCTWLAKAARQCPSLRMVTG